MARKLIVALAMLLAAQAPTYRIRIAVIPEVGHSQTVSDESHDQHTYTVRNPDGKVRGTQTGPSSSRSQTKQTTVRRAGSNATFRMQYILDEKQDEKGRTIGPLQGKTLTVTVRGDSVGIMSTDGEPVPETKRESITHVMRNLAKLDASNVCVPTGPLAIGSTWNISAEDAGECFATGGGTGESHSTGTLTAVDGTFATIDFRFSFHLKNLGPLVFDAPAPVEGTMQTRVSLNDPLLWTNTLAWHIAGTAHPRGPSEPSLFTELRLADVTRSAGDAR